MLHVFWDALVIPVEVGMPDLPVIEIVSLDVLETEGDRRDAVHDEMGVIGTPSLFRNRTSFPEAYLEREIRIDRRNRFANLDEIVVHRLGNGHGCGDGRSAVPVEVVRDLLQGNGFLLDEILRTEKSIFLADLPSDTYERIKQDLTEVQAVYDNEDSILVVPVSTDLLKSMKIIGQNINVDVITHNKNTLFF